MIWSVSVDTSCSDRVFENTARLAIGCWLASLLARDTVGSLTSRGKPLRTCAILSRTSCAATAMSTSSRNSTLMKPVPSRMVE
jgi:hypothetical protein